MIFGGRRNRSEEVQRRAKKDEDVNRLLDERLVHLNDMTHLLNLVVDHTVSVVTDHRQEQQGVKSAPPGFNSDDC